MNDVRKTLAKWLRSRADHLDPPRPLTHPVYWTATNGTNGTKTTTWTNL